MNAKKHLKWIDGTKFIALMAVMIDHTAGVLRYSQRIQLISFFSVSLFILISGITAWIHEEKKQASSLKKYGTSIKKITYAYFGATFFYQIFNHKFFDFSQYFYYIIHFNASGPFYFVLLYLQILIFRQPFKVILRKFGRDKREVFFEGIILVIIIGISHITTLYTDILGVYGGGGKLFGGTYLILFYVGMLIAKHRLLEETKTRAIGCTIVFGGLWFLWIYMNYKNIDSVDSFISAGNLVNPPGMIIMLSACLVLPFSFGLFEILNQIRISWLSRIIEGVCYVGRHTLYIFLYHNLFLEYFLSPYVMIENIWLRRVVFLIVMIGGSLMVEKLLTRLASMIKKLYDNEELQERGVEVE